MLPIFKEYCQFLKDKTGIELEEGYYWYDKSIIKGFDKDFNEVKLYRLTINDDLSMSYTIPKSYKSYENNNLISWNELIEINKKRLNIIEEESIKLIKDKVNKYSEYKPIIPISTGKDSMVTLHLVRKILPDIRVIFNNTSLDCADTYRMVKAMPEVEIMNPKRGFYDYVKTDKVIPSRFARFCCRIFKTGVMVEQLEHNIKYLFFMGMRNEESATRADYEDEWINKTEWGKTEWQGILPIRKWSELDVWLYILKENIQINPKYKKGYNRVGCAVACPFYTKSTWVLDEYWYPTMRQRWVDILTDDFIEEGKWNVLNCTLEEYIQKGWNGGMLHDNPSDEVIKEFMDYKDISDENIARKYFNNTCHQCGKKVKKDEVGLSMKYFGRNNNKMMCWKCLGKILNKTRNELKEDVVKFKEQGCSLF